MEASSSRKRTFTEYSDSDSDPGKAKAQKRVRFPKGKKARPGATAVGLRDDAEEDEKPKDWKDPRQAAKDRARRRSQMTTELLADEDEQNLVDISQAEDLHENYEDFVEDGIQIEPFNLKREREEGYFDAEGNFVEYVNEKEEKDAWLDSVEVDPKLAKKVSNMKKDVQEDPDLSSDDVGQIKRRIADVLEPGETILYALKRLKGNPNNKRQKMSAETKVIFDQLTEDAMKLMENGDYNVYHEKQEVFLREAEGYERLARAKNGLFDSSNGSNTNGVAKQVQSPDAADAFDMFGDDDEISEQSQPHDVGQSSSVDGAASSQMELGTANTDSEGSLAGQSDYVYDESSGYYYSSSLGYYYDPTSGLYCNAVSGQWYSFNDQTGTYEEIKATESNAS
ncbi:SUPPRESSOR OF ABI3-5-like protein [Drosera capensis]